MKKINYIFLTLLSIYGSAACISCSRKNSVSAERTKEVIVYTYDSFMGEWGPGVQIAKDFETATGFKVTYVNCGDGAQILSKALLEKESPRSDVLLGLDNNLIDKARSEKILAEYKPKNADNIIPEGLHKALGKDWLLTPYDYSQFALIYDTQSDVPAPESLEDLTKPEYAKKVILMDPRTSTPGLGFLAWTLAVFGDGYARYWKALKPSILTMSPGWSAGYGLFTAGEAPLVISYMTSPAYHVYAEKTTRYKALVFAEGHVQQVEGAGITRGALNGKGARAFMDYLISDAAQNVIPLTQWMVPADKNITLPDCYKKVVPEDAKTLSYNTEKVSAAVNNIMNILGN
ncbi:MAG: thiamine ABC transporter substrate-binding protein [Treponema sp.]